MLSNFKAASLKNNTIPDLDKSSLNACEEIHKMIGDICHW
jgi:hypothetical protein